MGLSNDRFADFYIDVETSTRLADIRVVGFYVLPPVGSRAARSTPPKVARSVVVTVAVDPRPKVVFYTEIIKPMNGLSRTDFETKAIELIDATRARR